MSEKKVNNFKDFRLLEEPYIEVYKQFLKTVPGDKKLYVDPNDVRGWWIYKNAGTQDKKVIALYNLCKKAKTDLFVDVGANYGEFSIMVANLVDRVICFEPNPNVFPYLQKSFAHLDNVTLFRKALGTESKKCEFTFNRHYSGGGSTIIERPLKWKHKGDGNNIQFQKEEYYDTIKVHMVDIVEFLQKQTFESLFIKLDCEGLDWEIVKRIEGYLADISIGFGKSKKWRIMFERDSKIHTRHEIVNPGLFPDSEIYKFCQKTNSTVIEPSFSTDDVIVGN